MKKKYNIFIKIKALIFLIFIIFWTYQGIKYCLPICNAINCFKAAPYSKISLDGSVRLSSGRIASNFTIGRNEYCPFHAEKLKRSFIINGKYNTNKNWQASFWWNLINLPPGIFRIAPAILEVAFGAGNEAFDFVLRWILVIGFFIYILVYRRRKVN